jgi:hypothetical protein
VSPRPRDCQRCGVRPVAYAAVKFCYDCRPTFKKRKAPPCKRCGSLDYYSGGLCRRCHKYAPPLRDSCRYCDSWGLFKETSGVCPACQDWRRHPGEAECRACGVTSALHPDGVCRLCWRRARVLARHPEDPRDRAEGVVGGHQLHFAGMEQALALTVPGDRRPPPRPPILAAAHQIPQTAGGPAGSTRCLPVAGAVQHDPPAGRRRRPGNH